jgi:regulator of protease activity HflC (stomatin/prohibitin superfamily)
MTMEKRAFRLPGFAVLPLLLALVIAAGVLTLVDGGGSIDTEKSPGVLVAVALLLLVLAAIGASGFVVLNPNEAAVVQFVGTYLGTVREAGLSWVLPLTSRRRVTLRVRNFETPILKVNDLDGNPVEIAAVVVWRVVDTAKATFAVEAYEQYVRIQTETAVRHLATSYPYDAPDDVVSLRDAVQVAEELTAEIRERAVLAGVEVIESRITHLAYAPEIAQAMLQRQQAGAVVAARSRIVEGAVGMVQMALAKLREEDVVDLDEERKAAMVSNLLVVLCGDRGPQPVVNAGTLYS